MIAQELEVSLHMAFVEARQKRHEFITVEHLLLALLDNPTAAEVLRSCGANMDELRKNLTQHITEQTPRIAADREVDTQPTLGFQRVIQRAILHVQSSGQEGGHRRQRAGGDLRREGLARGLLPAAAGHHAAGRGQLHLARHHQERRAAGRQGRAGKPSRRTRPRSANSPLDNYTQNLNALALAGKIDPLIGRDKEIERVIQTLVPPAQEQPAAGRRSRRRQDGDRRGPRAPHRRGQRARPAGEVHRLRARHGRPAGRHQVPRAISSSA